MVSIIQYRQSSRVWYSPAFFRVADIGNSIVMSTTNQTTSDGDIPNVKSLLRYFLYILYYMSSQNEDNTLQQCWKILKLHTYKLDLSTYNHQVEEKVWCSRWSIIARGLQEKFRKRTSLAVVRTQSGKAIKVKVWLRKVKKNWKGSSSLQVWVPSPISSLSYT